MFKVHSVRQRPNLRHLDETLGGAESLLEAVSFKKATEGMGRGRAMLTVQCLLCYVLVTYSHHISKPAKSSFRSKNNNKVDPHRHIIVTILQT